MSTLISSMIPIRLSLFVAQRMSRLRSWLLGTNVTALLVNSRNGRLLIDSQDRILGRQLAKEGEYGWGEIKRLRSYINEDDDVLIVGAHVGSIAIPIAQHCRSVTAVEANPRTFELLQLNLRINGMMNIHPVHIAASDKQEQIRFVMNRVNSGGSKRMPLKQDYIYFWDSPDTVMVDAKPLDAALSGLSPSVIFMDIEGSEYFAIQGMQRLLRETKTFFMEFVPHHLRNVSGVSVEELLKSITPHFTTLFVPTKNLTVPSHQFLPLLQEMFDADEADEGLIFTK